jgi:opacity protein-like surface antigen
VRTTPALAAVFAALCSAQAALAQGSQLPPVPFYDWTGVYLGANLGYASATISNTTTSGSTSTTSSQTMTGFIGGGQLGANFQYRHTVFGVEVDADASSQKASSNTLTASMALVCDGPGPARICTRPDSLLRDRGRGLRPILELGNHDLFDGRPGHHDGNLAANGMGCGRRKRIGGDPECDPSLRISLSATAREHAKFRERHARNLERTRVQPDRSSWAELQIRVGWILGPRGLIEKESSRSLDL